MSKMKSGTMTCTRKLMNLSLRKNEAEDTVTSITRRTNFLSMSSKKSKKRPKGTPQAWMKALEANERQRYSASQSLVPNRLATTNSIRLNRLQLILESHQCQIARSSNLFTPTPLVNKTLIPSLLSLRSKEAGKVIFTQQFRIPNLLTSLTLIKV